MEASTMTDQITVRFSIPAPIAVNILAGAEVARARVFADQAQATVDGFAGAAELAKDDAVTVIRAAQSAVEQEVGTARDAAVAEVGAATQTVREIAGQFHDLALISEVAAQAEQAKRRIDALQASQTADRIIRASWAELSALAGSGFGRGAEVLDRDTETHGDPVSGAAVPNAGVYSWSVSPAGWTWIGASGLAAKADRSELASALAVKAALPRLFTASTLPEPSAFRKTPCS
jgi:hypothetical protein